MLGRPQNWSGGKEKKFFPLVGIKLLIQPVTSPYTDSAIPAYNSKIRGAEMHTEPTQRLEKF
jgi:hypothetical protein